MHTASGGAQAPEVLESEPVTVVVPDVRMPRTDGAAFPAQVSTRHPDAVPIPLTGRADAPAAVVAVYRGQIHRSFTRSCPPMLLRSIARALIR